MIKKYIYNILTIWIIAVSLLVVIVSSNKLPAGIRFFIMETASMEPEIPVGSIIVSKQHPFYRVNEIITFNFPGTGETVTHRIVNQYDQNEKTFYITKGDNNDLVDYHLIPIENILGKEIGNIPLLGFFIKFVKTKLGLVMLIAIPATLVARKEILIIIEELSKVRGKRIKNL